MSRIYLTELFNPPGTLLPLSGLRAEQSALSEHSKRWRASLLLLRGRPMLARLIHNYRELLDDWRRMPRRVRRTIRQRVGFALGSVALFLALSRSPVSAATINVAHSEVGVSNNGLCSLVEAIENANDTADGLIHDDCAVGNPTGADSIQLPAAADFALTSAHGYHYQNDTGLPLITSAITIKGNDAVITRDNAAAPFRLLAVSASGNLTVNNATLSNGYANNGLGYGGGIYVHGGTLSLNHSVLTNNYTTSAYNGRYGEGGGVFNRNGTVTISNSMVTGNAAGFGGGLFNEMGTVMINNSTLEGNSAGYEEHHPGYVRYRGAGGAIDNASGTVTIQNSTLSNNYTERDGGGVFNAANGVVVVEHSTLKDNRAFYGDGGGVHNQGTMTIINSTVSGNWSNYRAGGGAFNIIGTMNVTNSTVTDNYAEDFGSGIHIASGTLELHRTLVSGNLGDAEVVSPSGAVLANDRNLFGYSGDAGVSGFTPGASDIVPAEALADILDTTLRNNGGPTDTHALVAGSSAIDVAPNADCTAAPIDGLDQRGQPRNANGEGSAGGNECDIGAVEWQSPVVLMSTTTGGTTADGVSFGPEDVLRFDGTHWSRFFDGSAFGLSAAKNVSAIDVPNPAGDDLYLSFAAAKTKITGLGTVLAHDILRFDGAAFSFFFDGSDVGLTTTGERLDALDVLPGSVSPIGSGCDAYLLVSTTGAGNVPASSGGNLPFKAEDVLGFCATDLGTVTNGKWHMVLDGSAEGMPAKATFGLSADPAATLLRLTTMGGFNVDGASGSHSQVYEFNIHTGEFSGPIFNAPAEGLPAKVDGLEVVGDLR